MKKLIGILAGFAVIIALCTFIVAQEGGVDVPQKPESGGGGLPDETQKALEDLIKAATDKLADLGQKKLSESDLDSVLKETLSAIDALKKLLNQTKDAAMKDIINQLIKELNNIKEIVELTKREYSWNDVYGCPCYNKQRAADALRKIDEILKKLAGGK